MDIKEERILVTGGTGFLGGHLRNELLKHGIPESNLIILSSKDYDLTSEDNVCKMYNDMQPAVVIHLAAEVGGIGANMERPGRFFYANMVMGLHLIEFARIRKIKKFIQIGTVCAYPKFTPVPFSESDIWNGYPEETNAPYGIAKKALMTMLQAYRSQYKLNGIYLVPVNLYGPNDNFDPRSSHVIPALIRKFHEAKKFGQNEVVVWGSGSASREFLYVEDAARGIVMALVNYDKLDPVNLGTGNEITIKDLVLKIKKIIGFEGKVVWDTTKPDGQPRRCLDTTRAQKEFGFEAKIDFDEGLRRTISSYQSKLA